METCRREILQGEDPPPWKKQFCPQINDWLPLLEILRTVHLETSILIIYLWGPLIKHIKSDKYKNFNVEYNGDEPSVL